MRKAPESRRASLRRALRAITEHEETVLSAMQSGADAWVLSEVVSALDRLTRSKRGSFLISFETIDETEAAGALLEAAKLYHRIPTSEHARHLTHMVNVYGMVACAIRTSEKAARPRKKKSARL